MYLLVSIKLFILLVQDCRCILQHEYVKQGNSRGGVDIWKYGNFLRQNKKKGRIYMGLAEVQFMDELTGETAKILTV